MVFFRHSEVISAGNLFSTISYPVIEVDKGGTIDGVIAGLNKILDLAVAEYRAQGGMDHPGRGRLSDTADVASYRNMVTIIRDRVRDLKRKGMTLAQVKAARPTWISMGVTGPRRAPGRPTCLSKRCIRVFGRKSDANASSGYRRGTDHGHRGVRPPFVRRHTTSPRK